MRRGICRGLIILVIVFSMCLGGLSYQLEARPSTIEICEGDGLIGDVEIESMGVIIL